GALTFAVTRDRGMSPADLGFILSSYGAGNLLGALLGGRFTHGPLAPLLLGGYFVQGLAILLIGIPMSLPLILLLGIAFAGGFGSGLMIVAYITYQENASQVRLLVRSVRTATYVLIW